MGLGGMGLLYYGVSGRWAGLFIFRSGRPTQPVSRREGYTFPSAHTATYRTARANTFILAKGWIVL